MKNWTQQQMSLLVLLMSLAVVANIFSMPLLFGVDFLFGSIFVMVILYRYGLWPAFITTLIASAYTYLLWKHPYAIIFLCAEILWVGWLYQRSQHPNFVLYDIMYWLVLGIPLVWGAFSFAMNMPLHIIGLVALKWSVNSLFNTIIAVFLITYTPFGKRQRQNSDSPYSYTLSFRQIIYNILTLFVLAVTFMTMFFNTHVGVQSIRDRVVTRLRTNYAWADELITVDLRNTLNLLHKLDQRLQNSAAQELHTIAEAVQQAVPNVLGLCGDYAKRINLSPVCDVTLTSNTTFPHFSPMQHRPGFDQATMRIDISPRLYVFIDTTYWQQGLRKLTNNVQLYLTILDHHNYVIASSFVDQLPAKPFTRHQASELQAIDDNMQLWVPNEVKSQSTIAQWGKSFYVYQAPLQHNVNWQLVIEIPLASYQRELFSLYLKNLSAILAVAFFIVLVATWLSRWLVSSLEKLSTVTFELTRNFTEDKQLYFPHSHISEVIKLINHFSHMAQSLRQQYQQLNAAYQAADMVNQKLTHSINYAQNIQHAMLPNEAAVRRLLPDSFILWQPRDVISGDMVYIENVAGTTVIVVLDCTGHGVPGALLTMLAINNLRRIVESEGCTEPALILQHLSTTVKINLRQNHASTTSNDGLDAAVCCVHLQQQIVEYAGARIPLFYIHNNQIQQILADKYSLGYKRAEVSFNFTTHRISLLDTVFYLATDGFTDQMGGDKGLPLGNKRFQAHLLSLYKQPLPQQAASLQKVLFDYQAERERQDDITIVGFRF